MGNFDLVLAEWPMPDTDALDFVERLSLGYPGLPVVLVSRGVEPSMVQAALRSGASDVVSRPLSARALAAIVFRNVERRELERKRLNEAHRTASLRSLRSLAAAIDAREHHTARHSRRVAELARTMGFAFDLPPEEMELLTVSARVHDVGKIGVPDRVLNKPGPLTESEWEVMRAHATIGADIVGEVPELAQVATVVRHHHERMDGGGYPDGLSGGRIPYFSRIIAVVDAYECMTSERASRGRLSADKAMRELHDGAGTQFDRQIVERFLSLQGYASARFNERAARKLDGEVAQTGPSPLLSVVGGTPGSPS
jgi:HD-GYP domain-containing protein (c-di-GMP phosphodiesterase class II)